MSAGTTTHAGWWSIRRGKSSILRQRLDPRSGAWDARARRVTAWRRLSVLQAPGHDGRVTVRERASQANRGPR
jgi:hypothetical protein